MHSQPQPPSRLTVADLSTAPTSAGQPTSVPLSRAQGGPVSSSSPQHSLCTWLGCPLLRPWDPPTPVSLACEKGDWERWQSGKEIGQHRALEEDMVRWREGMGRSQDRGVVHGDRKEYSVGRWNPAAATAKP